MVSTRMEGRVDELEQGHRGMVEKIATLGAQLEEISSQVGKIPLIDELSKKIDNNTTDQKQCIQEFMHEIRQILAKEAKEKYTNTIGQINQPQFNPENTINQPSSQILTSTNPSSSYTIFHMPYPSEFSSGLNSPPPNNTINRSQPQTGLATNLPPPGFSPLRPSTLPYSIYSLPPKPPGEQFNSPYTVALPPHATVPPPYMSTPLPFVSTSFIGESSHNRHGFTTTTPFVSTPSMGENPYSSHYTTLTPPPYFTAPLFGEPIHNCYQFPFIPAEENRFPRWENFPRRMDIPVFSGENPEGWLSCVERYFQINGYTEAKRISSSLICFEGATLGWYQFMEL